MTDKELMEKLNKSAFGYEAKTVFTHFRQAVFSLAAEEDAYLLVVNERGEAMQSFTSNRILQVPFSDILSTNLECHTKEYKIVLMVKKPKPTYLDKVEENYLRNIIAPLAKLGCSDFTVEKINSKDRQGNGKYYIRIRVENPSYCLTFPRLSEFINLPMYDKSLNMYRGLETGKKYSIDYLVE
jgi:hypothetical protein